MAAEFRFAGLVVEDVDIVISCFRKIGTREIGFAKQAIGEISACKDRSAETAISEINIMSL
jgi:hypothetical protein